MLAGGKEVNLILVFGHSGVHGYENTDELDRQGAKDTCLRLDSFWILRKQITSALNV